ncbi:ArsA family ATPase [Nocardioides yefusunii]|uniref:ArsA family ATPase n=1 Tax=Nocardioides yefusunii TaxID=2500546 RepID=A0ABW1QVL3_9ACTN|nr:ArsA family ATPase [Nocardioides yefusunii]
MRILLFTGKGGVGKSTVSAGTGALLAERGLRTLVVSTDTAHSLGDAFGVRVGADPVQVTETLWVQHVDAQRRFEESWLEIQTYLLDVMTVAGVDPVAAEELTVLPGAEEVLALLELRRQAASGDYDAIVVDCAPTAETLRLLSLPEALTWYMDRVFPPQRRVMRTFGPLLGKAVGMPMPGDGVFAAVERLHGELSEVRALLTGPETTVRLVMTPEQVVLAEARRAWTTLSMHGYRVDAVVVNRVFPAVDADAVGAPADWLRGWVQAQNEVLAEAEESFAPVRLWRSGYRDGEPRGVEALRDVAAALHGDADPLAEGPGVGSLHVEVTENGATMTLPVPLATRADTSLARRGGDLVVQCGTYRRVLSLPAILARMKVTGASVADGTLRVQFVRDPDPGGPSDGPEGDDHPNHHEERA